MEPRRMDRKAYPCPTNSLERFKQTTLRLKRELKLIRANDRPPSKVLCILIEKELTELAVEIKRLEQKPRPRHEDTMC